MISVYAYTIRERTEAKGEGRTGDAAISTERRRAT